jgi:hypothetical protein
LKCFNDVICWSTMGGEVKYVIEEDWEEDSDDDEDEEDEEW